MDQLDMLPSEEDLHLLVDNFTGQLPALQSLGVGDGIKGGLAILPWQLKDQAADGVDAAFALAPQPTMIHSVIDTVVSVSNLAFDLILPFIPSLLESDDTEETAEEEGPFKRIRAGSNDTEVTAAEDVEQEQEQEQKQEQEQEQERSDNPWFKWFLPGSNDTEVTAAEDVELIV